ncbi:hypothetical protein HGRIS_001407 [Hohenbuehelia grisea]|uniref:Uncharacterized protein n=1 Tax=Hohenbuehelia grisea TaxID=104357 RepID=A0ABR3JR31_9AGAR
MPNHRYIPIFLLSFHLEIHPPVFAVDRVACSVDREGYKGPMNATSNYDGQGKLRPQYYERAEGSLCTYLLEPNEGVPGQLHCAVRGKYLAIAAGNLRLPLSHLVVIHFGLEGHIVPMATSVYREIVESKLIASDHDDAKKARLMWSLQLLLLSRRS